MRGLALTLALVSLLALGAPGQEAPDTAYYFPDDTSVFLAVRNSSRLYELEDDHPLKQFVNHPAVALLGKEMAEATSEMIDEELLVDIGMTREELAKAFPGRLAAGLRLEMKLKTEIEAEKDPEGKNTGKANLGFNLENPDIAITADCTLTAEQLEPVIRGVVAYSNRKADSGDDEEAKWEISVIREVVDGYTVFRLESEWDGKPFGTPAVLTLVDGVLVISIAPSEIKKGIGDGFYAEVVRRVESGGREGDSLAGTDGYLDVSEKLERMDLYAYAPLEKIARALESAIIQTYDDAEKNGQPVGLLVSKDALLKTLGFGELKAFTLAGSIVPDGGELLIEVSFAERNGMVSKLLTYDDRGVVLPSFSLEGTEGIVVSALDLGGIAEKVFGAIKEISPMAFGLVNAELVKMQEQGLSLRDGILGSLGPGLAIFSGYSREVVGNDQIPSALIVLNLSDPEGMKRALAGLRGYLEKNGREKAQKREFDGETIYRLDELKELAFTDLELGQEMVGCYSVVGNKLLLTVGEADFMEHSILSLKEKGADLREDPAVEEAWGRWGDKDLVEFTYEDGASVIRAAAIGAYAGKASRDAVEDVPAAVKEAMDAFPPTDDFDFYFVEKHYNSPKAFTARYMLSRKPE